MFKEWGFLISEMVVLIVLAALLGLLVGWIIWGRRGPASVDHAQEGQLQAELDACHAAHRDKDAQIAALEADRSVADSDVTALEGDYDGDGVVEGTEEGVKPATLDAARGGQADDLKQIKGVGPKLEKLCNKLGFYHFDQIASWTPDEVAWVDANLEGFKNRVSRDNWIAQAQVLAAGGETDFSKRVEGGDVY